MHLGLVQAVGPLADGARLRGKYEVRTGERQGSHVLGKNGAQSRFRRRCSGAGLVTATTLGTNRSQAANLEADGGTPTVVARLSDR